MQPEVLASESAQNVTLPRVSVAALAALLLGSAIWIGLSRSLFFVGISEWDDALYVELAAIPAAAWELRNRYVHVWSLRIFQALFDSRQTAASVYATLSVVGTAWASFFLGRRLGGTVVGLVAAAALPMHPALLRHLTVPMADPPMVLWSTSALLFAVLSVEGPATRRRLVLSLASGLCCYLAAKTKETGLAVFPAVAMTLLGDRDLRRRRFAAWFLGGLAGWAVLAVLDRAFLPSDVSWHPSDWNVYLGSRSAPGPSAVDVAATPRPHAVHARHEFVGTLLDGVFLPYTLLGVAGLVHGVRTERPHRIVAHALGTWLVCSLLFSSLVAWRYSGIEAEARYCAVMGAPLVVLAASWIVAAWRRESATTGPAWREALALLVIAVATIGLVGAIVGDGGTRSQRAVFFGLPLAIALLFLVPLVTRSRMVVRGSLAACLALSATFGLDHSLAEIREARGALAPWIAFVRAADDAGASISRWQAPGALNVTRVERRVRALSRRPASEIHVKTLARIEDARANQWLFTRGPQSDVLDAAGWSRVAGYDAKRDKGWSVYRRRDDRE